jgi:two-component system C4-dicarboxylate transport response regulator DctD
MLRAIRVFVADDDPDMRELIAAALHDEYDVLVVESGEELLEQLATATREGGAPKPHVVVADVRMGGISGLEVLDGLKRDAHDVPVVMITGLTDPSTLADARRLGADAFLRKPFDAGALRSVVRRVAKRRMRAASPAHAWPEEEAW